MKRTIQGLLVTSVLVVGCGNTAIEQNEIELSGGPTMTHEEMVRSKQNLAGICNAITRYGLPDDRQTRAYVKTKVGAIADVAAADSDDLGDTARQVLGELADSYQSCDPGLARMIEEGKG